MNMRCVMGVLFVLGGCLATAAAWAEGKQDPPAKRSGRLKYPPQMPGAERHVYKKAGDTELVLYLFRPEKQALTDPRPAIVFFFGGGWRSGSPQQFEHQCRYMASRGMIAITADYRVSSRHRTKVTACVADGRSALRWVRANAKRLGVDPDRIAAGGGSAGGHVAACTALVGRFDEPGEDRSVRAEPDALVLFNPAAALAPFKGQAPLEADRMAELAQRLGAKPMELSPAHQVRSGAPPTIMFFGTEDRLLAGAQYFATQMKAVGSRCDLRTWEGLGHGFFNHGRHGNRPFVGTVRAMDQFLVSLGYLKGTATLGPAQ